MAVTSTNLPRINLHNHTCSSTGFYRAIDLVHAAIEGEIDVLGISDDFFRTPLSKECRNRKDFERLFISDVQQQTSMLQELQNNYDEVQIQIGGVIDLRFNEEYLMQIAPISNRFNYLLFKNVDQQNINQLLECRKKFFCPIGLCQNNLKANFPKFSIDRLVHIFTQHKIFIELDTRLPYFLENSKFFNRIRGSAVRITVGSDTHQDLSEVYRIETALDFIDRFGLENNLLHLPNPGNKRGGNYSRQNYSQNNNNNYRRNRGDFQQKSSNHNRGGSKSKEFRKFQNRSNASDKNQNPHQNQNTGGDNHQQKGNQSRNYRTRPFNNRGRSRNSENNNPNQHSRASDERGD